MSKCIYGVNDFETLFPDVAKEWHPTKNGPLLPSQVTAHNSQRIWWLCSKCGFEWQTAVSHRAAGHGCKRCAAEKSRERMSKKNLVIGSTDLASLRPDLIIEWDFSKNDISPSNVTLGSHKIVWWKCTDCAHEWQASINGRNRGNGCPRCATDKAVQNRVKVLVARDGSLFDNYPRIALDWDYEKNEGLLPLDITSGSNRMVHWKCSICGYCWEASIDNRCLNGSGCPRCASSGTSYPEQMLFFYIKHFFDDALNGYQPLWLGKSEIDIFVPAKKIGIEYDGEYYHSSAERDLKKSSICQEHGIKLIRVREHGAACIENDDTIIHIKPHNEADIEEAIIAVLQILGVSADRSLFKSIPFDYCNVIAGTGRHDVLSESHPYLVDEWNQEKNGLLVPSNFSSGSDRKVWWKCKKCEYEWQATIKNRTLRKSGCPKCGTQSASSIRNQKSLESKLKQYPILQKEWHTDKNGIELTPAVTIYQNQKYWWLCSVCGTEWQTTISSRIHQGSGCPKCASLRIQTAAQKRNLIVGETDLLTKLPSIAQEWHPTKNGNLMPCDVSYGSKQKVWWLAKCGHEWSATVLSRSGGTGCPYCSGKKVLAGFNDLETRYPELAIEWNYEKNAPLLPTEVTQRSHQRVWWKCQSCKYEWQATINSRSTGTRCPRCRRHK